MLFSSYDFTFLFLPIFLSILYVLKYLDFVKSAIAFSIVASLVFYAWWDISNLPILISSILVNYSIGNFLLKQPNRALLAIGCIFNVSLIIVFKYYWFAVGSFDFVAGAAHPRFHQMVVPLGLSFFTFQQIAWLVDSHRQARKPSGCLSYIYFISFFPQLIAGPIVHHSDVIPQIEKGSRKVRIKWDFIVGFSIFTIGLAKKICIADRLAPFADLYFSRVATGESVTFIDSWLGVLAYTFQIYFDFSAYSDMAIGLGRMCGIRLPVNFFSPYKARSAIEFWKRWHITLSQFLRDYVYFSLGGNRRGIFRRHANLLLTMLIGGLWHGANWTFVAWGFGHGVILIINHIWRSFGLRLPNMAALPLTFFSISALWVLFRADSFGSALQIYTALISITADPQVAWMSNPAIYGPPERLILSILALIGVSHAQSGLVFWALCVTLVFVVALIMPNTHEIFSKFHHAPSKIEAETSMVNRIFLWRPRMVWGVIIVVVFVVSIILMGRQVEFLYFEF